MSAYAGEDLDRFRDRLDILDLIHAYAHAIDGRRPAEVAALFTDESRFRAFDRPQGEGHGSAQIGELVGRLIDTFAATSHHVSGTLLRFTSADRASAVSSLHAWHQFRSDRPPGLIWGTYHDDFVRTPDGWKFAARTLTVSGQQDFDFPWISSQ